MKQEISSDIVRFTVFATECVIGFTCAQVNTLYIREHILPRSLLSVLSVLPVCARVSESVCAYVRMWCVHVCVCEREREIEREREREREKERERERRRERERERWFQGDLGPPSPPTPTPVRAGSTSPLLTRVKKARF